LLLTELQVRLNGTSTNYQGRVEVKYVGIWGTIDDDGWDILDATVVCRQLAFAGAIGAFTGSTFGQGRGPLWFSNVNCHGNETKLSQCIDYNRTISTANLNHKTDAGVECFSKCTFNQLAHSSSFIDQRIFFF
jgi:deleted-in-malignant-brain-tumors protein 1